jgi:hypothetical protein
MIHEAIHTQPDGRNHKAGFKRYASQVNAKYPIYQIQRCTSMEEYGCDREAVGRTEKTNWVIACNKCNHEFKYNRRPKYLESFLRGGGQCPYCKGRGFHLVKGKDNMVALKAVW